jgi:uncharacterized membrane protein
MKKVKYALWAVLLALVGIIIFQNQEYFFARQGFDVDLWVTGPYQSPEAYNIVYFLGCFLIGFFLAYLMGLADKYRAKKTVKKLNATIDAQLEKLSSMKGDLEGRKPKAPASTEAPKEAPPSAPAEEGKQ